MSFERKLIKQRLLPDAAFPHHRIHSDPPDRIESAKPAAGNSPLLQHRVMVGGSSRRPDSIGLIIGRGGKPMDYFAGLDVSMAETHICVVARTGAVIHKAKVPSTPTDIADELAQLPPCRRILFETGRMAPTLYHGLSQLGLPVVRSPAHRRAFGTGSSLELLAI